MFCHWLNCTHYLYALALTRCLSQAWTLVSRQGKPSVTMQEDVGDVVWVDDAYTARFRLTATEKWTRDEGRFVGRRVKCHFDHLGLHSGVLEKCNPERVSYLVRGHFALSVQLYC